MKKFLFVALLLLLVGNRCLALEAQFSKEHACIPAGENISSCEIHWGDTLSRFAVKSDSSTKTLKGLNPAIADPNLIYAGRRINIPDSPSNSSIAAAVPTTLPVQSHANASPVLTAALLVKELPPPEFSATAFSDEMNIASPALVQLTASKKTLKVVLAPAAIAKSAPPPPAPLPTSKEKGKTKPMKIMGYRLEIPYAVAFTSDGHSVIPLNVSLQTHVIVSRKTDEERIEVVSYAEVKGKEKNVVLSISLKKLPTDPFTVAIDGVEAPLNGAVIVSHAQPFQGRFPGQPDKRKIVMLTIARIGVSGTIMSFTMFGGLPIGYPVAVAAWAIPTAIRHHNAVVDQKNAVALATANANLAAATAAVQSFQGGAQ